MPALQDLLDERHHVGTGGDEWSVEDGRSVRTIKRVDSLIDVSPTTFPAYPDSDVAVAKRSYDSFRHSLSTIRESWTNAAARANELREYLKKHGR